MKKNREIFMSHPRGKPSKRSNVNQKSDKEMMGDLAQSILEVLKTDLPLDQEAFERYALQLRLRLHAEEKSFCNRFIEGYEALLDQLHPKSPQ